MAVIKREHHNSVLIKINHNNNNNTKSSKRNSISQEISFYNRNTSNQNITLNKIKINYHNHKCN